MAWSICGLALHEADVEEKNEVSRIAKSIRSWTERVTEQVNFTLYLPIEKAKMKEESAYASSSSL